MTATLSADLVLANRILVKQGVLDAYGHVSTRTAPGADTFLLSRSVAPARVTEADLLLHRLDGTVDADELPYVERFIHAEIYRARPDVMAIVHSHSPAVIPFGVTGAEFRPVLHMAAFLGGAAVPVYEIADDAGGVSDLLIGSPELGASLARALGTRSVALMRGHGSVATGAALPEAVFRAVYTEINARAVLQARALGTPRYLSDGEAEAGTETLRHQVRRAWDIWCAEAAAR